MASVLGGCATAGSADPDASGGNVTDAPVGARVDADPGAPDAEPRPDAAPIPDAMGTPDAAPVPDAASGTPDAAPPPPDAGCQDVVVQLLGNADFDAGPGVSWVETSQFKLINSAAELNSLTPHSGGYAVWMGGAYNSTDVLHQDVAIPAGATNVHLVGYRRIATEEIGGAYDTVKVELYTTGGALLETLVTWSNSDNNTAWTAFTLTPTGAYAGQTVRLRLESKTDQILNTNFFFDTFALRATVCQ